MMYNVFDGEYPFDKLIDTVEAENELEALQKALNLNPDYPHCVVEPIEIIGVLQ